MFAVKQITGFTLCVKSFLPNCGQKEAGMHNEHPVVTKQRTTTRK